MGVLNYSDSVRISLPVLKIVITCKSGTSRLLRSQHIRILSGVYNGVSQLGSKTANNVQ
jgi:hypothetical protein